MNFEGSALSLESLPQWLCVCDVCLTCQSCRLCLTPDTELSGIHAHTLLCPLSSMTSSPLAPAFQSLDDHFFISPKHASPRGQRVFRNSEMFSTSSSAFPQCHFLIPSKHIICSNFRNSFYLIFFTSLFLCPSLYN